MAIAFSVNGKPVSVEADADTPLLWALRDDLGLTGTKFVSSSAFSGVFLHACLI